MEKTAAGSRRSLAEWVYRPGRGHRLAVGARGAWRGGPASPRDDLRARGRVWIRSAGLPAAILGAEQVLRAAAELVESEADAQPGDRPGQRQLLRCIPQPRPPAARRLPATAGPRGWILARQREC